MYFAYHVNKNIMVCIQITRKHVADVGVIISLYSVTPLVMMTVEMLCNFEKNYLGIFIAQVARCGKRAESRTRASRST